MLNTVTTEQLGISDGGFDCAENLTCATCFVCEFALNMIWSTLYMYTHLQVECSKAKVTADIVFYSND